MGSSLIYAFHSSVAPRHYVSAAQLISSTATNDGVRFSSLVMHAELWMLRLLGIVAGVAGLIAMWFWSRSWLAVVLAGLIAPAMYILAERGVLALMAWADHRLSGVADRMNERDLFTQFERSGAQTGDRAVRVEAGLIEIDYARGGTLRLSAEGIERIIRTDGMTIIVKRGPGRWHERLLPFPDEGLNGALSPEDIYEALKGVLDSGSARKRTDSAERLENCPSQGTTRQDALPSRNGPGGA